jgi:benzoyl-CoA reductase/2-hydroxyglutaryl-CoA dehydratase subunit BcrC/BadD/HgdB
VPGRLKNIFEKAEDQQLKFDGRYTAPTKRKLQERRKHYKDNQLFDRWLSDNRKALAELKSPEHRPKAMGYYDELFTTDKVLQELVKLKKKGKKIIGTFCNLVPEELIYAAGAVPLRLCSGCFESIKPAEEAFPRDSCPLIKSSFGFAVTDQPFFSLCDAIALPSTCDGKKKMGEILSDYAKVWMLDLPQSKERNISKRYWLSEIRVLKRRLERLTKRKIGREGLKATIMLLQERSSLVNRLHGIRKRQVISGSDAFLVMQASFFDDLRRWMSRTTQLCDELDSMKTPIASKDSPRLLVTGAPIILPNFKIAAIIEQFDAIIAMDETCAGSQSHYDPVTVDEWNMLDMMRAVAERYLMPSVCPCFIKAEDRIDKLLDMVKEYRIDGVIYHTLRLCLLFDIESQKVRDVMEDNGIPFLHINTDYSKEDKEQLRTRIEAFIEILQSRKRKSR